MEFLDLHDRKFQTTILCDANDMTGRRGWKAQGLTPPANDPESERKRSKVDETGVRLSSKMAMTVSPILELSQKAKYLPSGLKAMRYS